MFDAVMAYGEKKVCEVDVSGRTVEDVVEEIIRIVNGYNKFRVGIVDWLMKLESEGRLDEFFAEFNARIKSLRFNRKQDTYLVNHSNP